MTDRFDVVVVGAGMAGASLAAELAPHASVLIVEAESQPGYHTTGRSAAFYEECYGGPDVVPLTLASGPYLREHGFLTPRGGLYVARHGQEAAVEAFLDRFADAGVTIEPLGRAALEAMLPGVRAGWDQALSQPHCADIDVGGLHQHYLAMARRGGARLRTNHRLAAAEREGDGESGGWRLDFGAAGEVRAGVLVNAAGAWADHLAGLAGARPLGVQPFRRTVMQLRTDPMPPADLPLVLDLNGEFYFRPENGRLWLSPHDEIPSDPCDAAPEDIDVALAIDRFEGVVDWRIEALEHKWAGLRSFAPDRLPVYGYDAGVPGFFWFAGQGGYGIQTAPAAARLGAQLLLGRERDAMTGRLNPALYAPERFAR
ncbi:FAD-dependent oxidoreductase [Erythrobacter arachoides]|uniref:FAD-dependent oxidoreductase n=1 Tax=Aurantiacibacter arachoides TaxID=1850444 RepID=A0A844ZVV3_9SPHN|nr:FAD-dependent oxidoreductase [Aurantiacibacter arachoides]MXO92431.1 FAD-dependent oxidoreductase [Aurantiacibacter arachoides]GGD57218.1 glycerol-3-phosphate dehydrogenase [Aurantiacibacter arachoides]